MRWWLMSLVRALLSLVLLCTSFTADAAVSFRCRAIWENGRVTAFCYQDPLGLSHCYTDGYSNCATWGESCAGMPTWYRPSLNLRGQLRNALLTPPGDQTSEYSDFQPLAEDECQSKVNALMMFTQTEASASVPSTGLEAISHMIQAGCKPILNGAGRPAFLCGGDSDAQQATNIALNPALLDQIAGRDVLAAWYLLQISYITNNRLAIGKKMQGTFAVPAQVSDLENFTQRKYEYVNNVAVGRLQQSFELQPMPAGFGSAVYRLQLFEQGEFKARAVVIEFRSKQVSGALELSNFYFE